MLNIRALDLHQELIPIRRHAQITQAHHRSNSKHQPWRRLLARNYVTQQGRTSLTSTKIPTKKACIISLASTECLVSSKMKVASEANGSEKPKKRKKPSTYPLTHWKLWKHTQDAQFMHWPAYDWSNSFPQGALNTNCWQSFSNTAIVAKEYSQCTFYYTEVWQ